MDRVLETAIAAALTGGRVARRYFGRPLEVERKSDESPVTVADRETEAAIVAVLRAEFPDYGILGEESGASGGDGPRWIVDPIDGTKSFIRGIPYFGSLIALEEEGEITAGVVYSPIVDDLLWARKGQGAFDRRGRLRVSEVSRLEESMLLFGGANLFHRGGYWKAYEDLVVRSQRQRGYGDFWAYTFVARGLAEAVIELDLKPWDMAAPRILVEEAGGRFSDFRGVASFDSGTSLASNGRIHDEILGVFAA